MGTGKDARAAPQRLQLRGRVVYVATLLEQAAFDRVLLEEVRAAGVANRFAGLPAHLECTVREDERHEYLFFLNHDADATVTVPLDGEGTDLLTGRPVAGETALGPLGAAVIRRSR